MKEPFNETPIAMNVMGAFVLAISLPLMIVCEVQRLRKKKLFGDDTEGKK